MALSSLITPHLPYLRRYARALTGSQDSGDKYVQATIEALVADPSGFSREVDPRVALFQVFLKLWNSIDINSRSDTGNGTGASELVDDRLAQITPLPRQAFLLVFVEGFAHDEAAFALGTSRDELGGLLDTASSEMAEQVLTDVLIIEDEPLIAMDINEIVQSLGHNVIGIARTKTEATDLVARRKPGIVLADIQLADGSSGIDAANEILGEVSVPVIFITAYPERLLTGMRPEPTFLMTKPFDPTALRATISQALFFNQRAEMKASA